MDCSWSLSHFFYVAIISPERQPAVFNVQYTSVNDDLFQERLLWKRLVVDRTTSPRVLRGPHFLEAGHHKSCYLPLFFTRAPSLKDGVTATRTLRVNLRAYWKPHLIHQSLAVWFLALLPEEMCQVFLQLAESDEELLFLWTHRRQNNRNIA